MEKENKLYKGLAIGGIVISVALGLSLGTIVLFNVFDII